MISYKLLPNNPFTGDPATSAQRLADNAFIPFDPANRDANEFALWLKEGNIPEPASEGDVVTQEWIQETINKLLP